MNETLLSVECLADLGLVRQPFASLGHGAFLYTDPILDMPLNIILEHLQSRSQPLLIKGETGIGKTTLLARIQTRSGDVAHLCPIESGPELNMAAVDYSIRLQWQPRPEHGDPRKLDTAAYLFALIEGGVRPVLLVDDAQRLSREVLSGLFELKQRMESDYGQQLGLLLAGEPVIEQRLSEIADKNRQVDHLYTVALRPLNRDQTHAYIEHRLKAAGTTDASVLDLDTTLAIHQASGGIPGKVDIGAARALEKLCGTGGRTHGRSWQQRMMLPATLLLVVAGLLVALYGLIGGLLRDDEEKLTVRPEQPIDLPESQEPSANVAPARDEPAARDIAKSRPALTEEPPPSENPPAASAEDSTQANAPAIPPQPPPTRQPTPPAIEEPSPTPSAETATAQPVSPETVAKITAPPAKPAAPAAQEPTRDKTLMTSVWLLQQDPDAYTIQILGVSHEAAVRRFYQDHPLTAPTAFYKTRRPNGDWYVLVTGVYANPEQARAAIEKLPVSIRTNEPWIRRLADVQLAILTAQETTD